jgi:cell division protein FtsI/penicillin-binding protein 2
VRLRFSQFAAATLGLWLLSPARGAAEEPPEPAAPPLDLASFHHTQAGLIATKDAASITIDPGLEPSVDQLLAAADPQWGGAVLAEVKSGKILAFSQYRRTGEPRYQELATRLFPSASVFKLVTTAALLEHTPVTLHTRVCVSGGEHGIARRHLVAPNRGPKGGVVQCLPFSRALGLSVNAAYAQLVTRYLTRADLQGTVDRFGFNQPLAFDAPALLGKVDLPSDDLQFARTAIGFENTELTVLGATAISLMIAREGKQVPLRLLANDAGAEPEKPTRILRATTAHRIAHMMELTVHGGTALSSFTDPQTRRSYLADLRVAAKTGTLKQEGRSQTVSWFTGFAPARNPKVVVTVMLENGPHFRAKAADVARDLLRVYFSDHRGISAPTQRAQQVANGAALTADSR